MNLNRAIAIAAEAHDGQADKGGAPYILHPLRVMAQMKTDETRIVAVLHDVAEDCPEWPLARLATEFGETVGSALDAITKRAGEHYDVYLSRVRANEIAREVKLADIGDNSNLSRLGRDPELKDLERLAKYSRATEALSSHL